MSVPQNAPFGTWKSPITADVVFSDTIKIGKIIATEESVYYWAETRPSEQGRCVVVQCTPEGKISDVTPPPCNVRNRIHEYGGAAYTVFEGTIFFTNFSDQRLYRLDRGQAPYPITPDGDLRYADFIVDKKRNRLIGIREDHTTGASDPVNEIVTIPMDGNGTVNPLISGNDFYSSPCISPDGSKLAWLTWNHPHMPWDVTELWIADIEAGGNLVNAICIAGGTNESIFQPEWSPDDTLYFVSDRTGWWNLYRWREDTIEPIYTMEAEFGRPHWGGIASTYGFESDRHIISAYTTRGIWYLARIGTESGRFEPIDTSFTAIDNICVGNGNAYIVGGSDTEVTTLVRHDLTSQSKATIRPNSRITISSDYFSISEPIKYETTDGQISHGFFYPPQNKDYAISASDELPPLMVICHGGPTASTSKRLFPFVQYWTSRGIAVLDVNYRGSTGYGREYRRKLYGQWGVADVDDCINGALFLADQKRVDKDRLIIRGGSAGGYTTLCALVFRDVFKAGASYYGISDVEILAKDTHKFESRYLDHLIGPYPAEQERYRERSPIHAVERLSCPVIFFQGLEDKVVPPNQAEMMVDALRKKGIPVAYLPYEDERHGFMKAENLIRSLEAEFYFYSRVFGFEPADSLEPIIIENLLK